MKEILKANDTQIKYLDALSRTLITARGAQQILESNPDSTATIEIDSPKLIIDAKELVSLLHGGAQGLYNELAHPLIENDQKIKYFRATDNRKLVQIYEEIDRLEKTRVEVTSYRNAKELFYSWAFVGLFLLLTDVGLSRTYLRRLP